VGSYELVELPESADLSDQQILDHRVEFLGFPDRLSVIVDPPAVDQVRSRQMGLGSARRSRQ
jgi:hypothetical protein